MESPAIGIDLGTTHSCVAVYRDSKLEIISNDDGFNVTPSCVSFLENEIVVGNDAKRQKTINPENTIYDVKRFIGRRFDEPSVQSDIANLPFKVLPDNDHCKIEVTYNGSEETFKPEEISAMLLRKLKHMAEDYLDAKITKAVITVPAYFNDHQRQATIDAGELAGLEVLRILNEPTAAAIAYGTIKEDMEGTFLVYDFGGGTLDVSVVTIDDTGFAVKATSGNAHLGDEDIHNNMVEYFDDLFQQQHGKSIKSDKRALARLKQECDEAKKILSFKKETTVIIDAIMDDIDFNETLTRDVFNTINEDLFNSTLIPVKDALKSAKLTQDDISKVIMVGGASRIPKLQSLLEDFFGSVEVYKTINSDEAIAYGAGIYAAILTGVQIEERDNFVIIDVTPMSLSTDVVDGVDVIIPRNSVIPISETRTYATVIDNQQAIHCNVYEGENPKAEENNFLGLVSLTNVPEGPGGSEQCDLTFSVDENGVLKVTAVLLSTKEKQEIEIDRRTSAERP